MHGYLLEDWKTLNLDTSILSIIQDESGWLSFQPYSDIVFHTETKTVFDDRGGNVQLEMQTAPSKDASLFTPMVTVTLNGNIGVVQVSPILLAANPTVPLARWVRWRLINTGAPTTNWSASFRIHCTANAVGLL